MIFLNTRQRNCRHFPLLLEIGLKFTVSYIALSAVILPFFCQKKQNNFSALKCISEHHYAIKNGRTRDYHAPANGGMCLKLFEKQK